LGRPKKTLDFGSELIRELNLPLTINDGGKRKVIKKLDGIVKQLVHRSLSGNDKATRLVVSLYQPAIERAEEQRQNSPNNSGRGIEELTDEELTLFIRDERARLERIDQDGANGRKSRNRHALGK
jgi:polyhydroxyalkanoate synthesis regulator phasin